MKRYLVLFGLTLSVLLSGPGSRAQQCPTWSPKFNLITNPEILQKLRNFDWDKAVADAGGPEEVIASMKVTLKDAQDRLQNADRAAEATKAYGGPVIYDATWDQCRNTNMGANMAAKCEHLNMTEMILFLEGSIELLRCR
jgi:hypothetical protein